MSESKEVKRLPPKTSVLKKLFASSGNRCAMPNCGNPLIHWTGTMNGKVAHINAAEKGGARFDKNMSNEERRSIDNLMVVCAICHDVIDDKANEADYPAELLKQYKETHEQIYAKAESDFLVKYSDKTQLATPEFPETLEKLSTVPGYQYMKNSSEDIIGIEKFIKKLNLLPRPQRLFAVEVADRMSRRDETKLPCEEIRQALEETQGEVRTNFELIERHGLGSIIEDSDLGHCFQFTEREPGVDPWLELIEFCKVTKKNPKDIVLDLCFSAYD